MLKCWIKCKIKCLLQLLTTISSSWEYSYFILQCVQGIRIIIPVAWAKHWINWNNTVFQQGFPSPEFIWLYFLISVDFILVLHTHTMRQKVLNNNQMHLNHIYLNFGNRHCTQYLNTNLHISYCQDWIDILLYKYLFTLQKIHWTYTSHKWFLKLNR